MGLKSKVIQLERVKAFWKTLLGVSILTTGCAKLDTSSVSRLELIQNRGELHCGVSGKIPGFSFLGSDGNYEGFDVDICKAMAAAFLGDDKKVQYRPLTAPERFTALKTGEIDVLSRNTTFNLSRDSVGGNGVTFAPVVFHDGQGLMVKEESNVLSIDDLESSDICVGSGTTTEQNLNDTFQEKKLSYTPIKYQDLNQVIAGYLQGRCRAMTSDLSQLSAARSGFENPEKHIILNTVMSKEPLAPASIGGDQKLSDAIRWVIYALIQAEELNINKKNINLKLVEAKSNKNLTTLRRFLGVDGALGNKLGLENDFVVKIIQSTGNYADIYTRNLGPGTSVPIKRGLNALYKDGGVLISPPMK